VKDKNIKAKKDIPVIKSEVNTDYKKLELAKQISREQIDILTNIQSYLEEYLDDFIIIGHAINGSRINITHARTPKDQDSLEQFYTDNLIFMKNKKLKDII
jgi:proline dehydrogenase